MLAAERDEALGEALNLAGTGAVSIAELARLILELLGLQERTDVTYSHKSWKGDISMLLPDTAKAERLLGFRPQVTLRDGLTALIRSMEADQGWALSELRSR